MQTIPRDVHVGMRVYDSARNEIGKVENFRFSENQDEPGVIPDDLDASDRETNESLLQDIAKAFAPDDIPESLRERLLTEGYVRLDAKGLFAGDRYILPDQIDASTGDALMLNVTRDELIKRH